MRTCQDRGSRGGIRAASGHSLGLMEHRLTNIGEENIYLGFFVWYGHISIGTAFFLTRRANRYEYFIKKSSIIDLFLRKEMSSFEAHCIYIKGNAILSITLSASSLLRCY